MVTQARLHQWRSCQWSILTAFRADPLLLEMHVLLGMISFFPCICFSRNLISILWRRWRPVVLIRGWRRWIGETKVDVKIADIRMPHLTIATWRGMSISNFGGIQWSRSFWGGLVCFLSAFSFEPSGGLEGMLRGYGEGWRVHARLCNAWLFRK